MIVNRNPQRAVVLCAADERPGRAIVNAGARVVLGRLICCVQARPRADANGSDVGRPIYTAVIANVELVRAHRVVYEPVRVGVRLVTQIASGTDLSKSCSAICAAIVVDAANDDKVSVCGRYPNCAVVGSAVGDALLRRSGI